MPTCGPGSLMARDLGIKIKWLPFNKETFEFDLKILDDLLTDRTRLSALAVPVT